MSSLLLKPDRRFVEELTASGGGDLKKCFQCATCSVVCDLSNGSAPFPRKEMIWAQWGLKDRLMADPDIWLCHQCDDCSERCPRGARPGDVLSAVRQQAIRHYAYPGFLAKWINDIRYLPIVFAITTILLAIAIQLRDPIGEALPFAHHPGFYSDFFPHWLLIGFFSFFSGLAAVGLLAGLVPYWKAMRAADGATGPPKPWLAAFLDTVRSILVHDRFRKCTARSSRRSAHLWAFYGFAALFLVTCWAVTDLYLMPRLGVESLYPFGLLHPMKLLANVGALLLVAGCIKAISDRWRAEQSDSGTAFDLIFLWLLLGTGVTGVFSEGLRLVAETSGPPPWLETSAYAVYFVHLVLVFVLLVTLPYSKFAHVMWRTMSLVYAARYGRHQDALLPAVRGTEKLTANRAAAMIATVGHETTQPVFKD